MGYSRPMGGSCLVCRKNWPRGCEGDLHLYCAFRFEGSKQKEARELGCQFEWYVKVAGSIYLGFGPLTKMHRLDVY
jgi:hypothetical protein